MEKKTIIEKSIFAITTIFRMKINAVARKNDNRLAEINDKNTKSLEN